MINGCNEERVLEMVSVKAIRGNVLGVFGSSRIIRVSVGYTCANVRNILLTMKAS